MSEAKTDIKKLIDKDVGLHSKRKMLTVTSLILLAIQFSGAKVVEANTLILKLSFAHQKGITVLLMLAIIFLLIRYYNYAKPYHSMLYKLWTERLLDEEFYYSRCPHSDDEYGIVYDLRPSYINRRELEHGEHSSWGYEYECRLFFRRYITFNWYHDHEGETERVGIRKKLGFRKLFKSLLLEYKHRFMRFIIFRENLDIIAPYFLGVLAILSFFFARYLGVLLQHLESLSIL